MDAAKKTQAIILAVSMMLLLLPRPARAASVHEVSNPAELSSALATADSGDTIRLLDNVNYNGGITVIGKTLTFDTNGYTLNVTNVASGLVVHSGAW